MLWDAAGTSAFGTAAVARFFVALEQPGPWGRDAVRESHLGAQLGNELASRCADRSGRFVLLRRPGTHPDEDGPVTVLLAYAGGQPRGEGPSGAWLLHAPLERPETLLALDWDALARGDREAVAASLPGATEAPPVLLVCTNGRRDVCCAIRGRPIAAVAAVRAPDRVWESSHTGGHRFAPTGVLLPWGQTVARLTDNLAEEILEASLSGRVPRNAMGPVHDRGRSAHAPDVQCAESAIRAQLGEEDLMALWALAATQHPEQGGQGQGAPRDSSRQDAEKDVLVEHRDGRRWRVTVVRTDTGHARPESCGKAAVPVRGWEATWIRELPSTSGR